MGRASQLSTAAISDVFDHLGIPSQCIGIVSRNPTVGMTGRAYTVRYGLNGQSPADFGGYVDNVPRGSAIAIDGGGHHNFAVWGGIRSEAALQRGVVGTVIHGACRDMQYCQALAYPVYSSSCTMRTGRNYLRIEEIEGPIVLGGVKVKPGVILRGDADGVVAIPLAHEEQVLTLAEEVALIETRLRGAIRQGMSLSEALDELHDRRRKILHEA